MLADLDLHPALVDGLQQLRYKKLTQIQSLVLPEALIGKDILASSPTGTGKTAAFLIPCIQYLLDLPRQKPGFARVLILCPTREIALQTKFFATELATYTTLAIGEIIGGINYGTQHEMLESNNDILIATPGRLMDLMRAEVFEAEEVEILVIDEADKMLAMGFQKAMYEIVQQARHRRQSLLFSATLESHDVAKFAENMLEDPEVLTAIPPRTESSKIHQWLHYADSQAHKLSLLVHILGEEDCRKAIVFVNKKERLPVLESMLTSKGLKVGTLQGDLAQHKRQLIVKRFSSGQVTVLLATDVAARGLDIPDVSHIINYDTPYRADVYVHRIGRTARAGKKGYAISLVEAHDMVQVQRIERFTEQKLKVRVIDGLKPQHKPAALPKKKKKNKVKKVKGSQSSAKGIKNKQDKNKKM